VIARLGGVTLSVGLHAGLIALLVTWSAFDWTHPLFVDLVEEAGAPGSPAAASSAAPAAPRPAPAAPAPSKASAPVPAAPLTEPAAPPALAIAPEPVAAPPAASAPAPPADSSATSTPPEGRGQASEGAVASGAGVGSGTPTRGDAERGSGGGPGSSLALATPGTGGSGALPPEYGPYLQRFRQRVQESLIYPLAARRQGLGGTVELHVWLEATGRVRDVQVAHSSSHAVLDDAAVETIRRLGPVPFPESLPRRALLIRIPLVYELR
jgi:protein TonB